MRDTSKAHSTDEQVIDFNELKKGDVFMFEGKKKVYEVSGRSKFTIEYFPHDDVWGGGHSKKKTSKMKVRINFEY